MLCRNSAIGMSSIQGPELGTASFRGSRGLLTMPRPLGLGSGMLPPFSQKFEKTKRRYIPRLHSDLVARFGCGWAVYGFPPSSSDRIRSEPRLLVLISLTAGAVIANTPGTTSFVTMYSQQAYRALVLQYCDGCWLIFLSLLLELRHEMLNSRSCTCLIIASILVVGAW